LQKGSDDQRGASGFYEVSLGLRFDKVEFAKASFARHAGELELRRQLAHETALGLVVAGYGGECARLCGLAHSVVARAIRHLDGRRASGVSDGTSLRVCAREEGGDLHRARHLLDTARSAGREADGVSGFRHFQDLDLVGD
jgi:hypothetical protein